MFRTEKYAHKPQHTYTNEYIYFLTARCQDKNHYFNTDEKKKIFVSVFSKASKRYSARIYAWVLLNNHYHCLIQFFDKRDIGKFVNNLHTNSARLLNKIDNKPGRNIWYQYWDYCLRDKADFWCHLNYIIQNPLKHKLVLSLSEAYKYKFSSNPILLRRLGKWSLEEKEEEYPIDDLEQEIEDD